MSNEDDFLLYPSAAGSGWRPCIRVNSDGRQAAFIRPAGTDEDPPPDMELVHVEPIAPGIGAIKESYGRPAMANSRSYTEGWERIFGGRNEPGQA